MNIVRSLPVGLDRTGFWLSAGCAIHCALMPFAAGALSLVGAKFLAGEAAESILLGTAAVVAALSLWGGCRHHTQVRPVLFLLSGFALIVVGRTYLADITWAERVAVVSGAVCIASAHLVNWRLCCASEPPHTHA